MQNSFGRFNGPVHCEWCDDGRSMVVLRDLAYIDRLGRVWTAPAGSVVDGASIPRFCWRWIGSPFVGRYRRASVIHDVYCANKTRIWQSVHRVFDEMMAADRVPTAKRFCMSKAVWMFGPRWTLNSQPEVKTCKL
jgi:hypothetical protein